MITYNNQDFISSIHRYHSDEIPSMRDYADTLLNCDYTALGVKPCNAPYSGGVYSHTGNVRTENQDFGVVGELQDKFRFMILADGCGGVPNGKRAAYVCVSSIAQYLITEMHMLIHKGCVNDFGIQEILHSSFLSAGNSLAIFADKNNMVFPYSGLRSTAIISLIFQENLYFGYMGDGGLYRVSDKGETTSLLSAQRAEETAHKLTASLGPCLVGKPFIGRVALLPGDLIVAGTDGLSDRTKEDFFSRIPQICQTNNGDLLKTCQFIVEQFAAAKDEHGYICDDNITLGILGVDSFASHFSDEIHKRDKGDE
jgi:serine/threonine protein phosphatase PrpC